MCKLLIIDKHIHKCKPIGSYKLNRSRRLVLWTMSGLLYNVALIILLLQSQGDATTSIHQLHRNATHIVLQCETNQRQIVWKVGDNPGFEPEYNVNGSTVTAITTVPLTRNITVICIGISISRTRNGFTTSENDTFPVTVPLEVSPGSTTLSPSGSVPSSNNITTESTTPPPSGTVPSNDTTTDYGSMPTPTASTTPTENGTVAPPMCGTGCITGISVVVPVVVCILLAIPIILCVCWKKKKPECATLCSDTKNDTPQQPGRDAGIPVPETDPSCSESVMMVNGHPKSLTGPGTNNYIPEYVTTGIDEGEDRKVEFVTPSSTWRRLPRSITDRPSTEDLTSTGNIKDMDAIPVNDKDIQHFPYESGTAVAHICIPMESTKDKDCS